MFLTTIPVQLEIKIKVRADRDNTAVVERIELISRGSTVYENNSLYLLLA